MKTFQYLLSILFIFTIPFLQKQLCVQAFSRSVEDSTALVENVKHLRSEYKNRTTCDKIFAFPGKVIYLPFKLVFLGIKEVIVLVDESKIIPRVQDFLVSDDGKRTAQPTYVSRIGLGIKYRQYQILNPESRIAALAMFGLYQRQKYAIGLERVSLKGKSLFTNIGMQYNKLTTESFYGIGPDTEKEDRTNYTRERIAANIALGLYLSSKTTLETFVGFELNNILPGKNKNYPSTDEIYDNETLPGLDTKVKLSNLEFKFAYDSRNRIGNPSSGWEIQTATGFFQQIAGNQYGFSKFYLDVSRYIHLFYNRILKLRIGSEITEPFPDKEIPFYYLSKLGEDISFRGFDRGRFRDNDLILGTAEFRFPVSRNLEGMFFSDVGEVARNLFRDFTFKNLQITFGGGLRFVSPEGSVTKLEIGKSQDGFLVKFTLN